MMYGWLQKVQPAGGESPAQAVEGLLTREQQRAVVTVGNGCSGVLITPRVVLTAGHCIRNRETGRLRPPQTIGDVKVVDYGCDQPLRAWASIEDVAEPAVGVPWDRQDLDSYGNDVVLLLLEGPVPASAATPLSRGLAPDEGERVIVGGFSPWANCPQRGFGWFTTAERWLTSVWLIAESGVAARERPGDSGGPAIRFANGRPQVFGVVSAGDSALNSTISRVDTLQAWIDEMIRRWEGGGRSRWYEPLYPVACPVASQDQELFRTWVGTCVPRSQTDSAPSSPTPAPEPVGPTPRPSALDEYPATVPVVPLPAPALPSDPQPPYPAVLQPNMPSVPPQTSTKKILGFIGGVAAAAIVGWGAVEYARRARKARK